MHRENELKPINYVPKSESTFALVDEKLVYTVTRIVLSVCLPSLLIAERYR